MKNTPEDMIRPINNVRTGNLEGFHVSPEAARRNRINRRAFLRGAGTVAIGLPFLEGLPERSAWAQSAPPVFTMVIVGSSGVVGSKFFPSATGPLTAESMKDKAVSVLAPHAANLLFVKNVSFPQAGPKGCGHAEGLVQSLTAMAPGSTGNGAYAMGPSADVVIAKAVNPGAADPMTMYVANKGVYVSDRISFKAGGAGQVRAGDQNPYTLFSKVVGLTTTGSGGMTMTDPVAAELAATRKSVNDLVRAELNSLMSNSALSSADKLRLKQHFECIREVEITTGTIGASCTKNGLSADVNGLTSQTKYATDGATAVKFMKMHMEVVALAFACNYNRVAAIQWGDGTDGTKYNVPANAGLGWTFHQLSHRVQSDSATGNNATAEQAHAEVDALRMETLLYGLDQFKARGLQDKSMVVWLTHIADGPSHTGRNVPHIIWGSGGGYLKQGQYVDAGSNTTNNKLWNTIISAAVRDKSTAPVNFAGAGEGTQLTAIKV